MYPKMHISLYVSRLNESIRFYQSFFQTEPVKVKPGYAKFELESPSLVISFVENPARVASNFGHLGFQVESKEEMMHRLEEARKNYLVSKEEIGTACCFALQDKFWAEDPDGYQWEVYYFHDDVDFNDPKFEEADTEQCCIVPTEEEKPKLALKDIPVSSESSCCDPSSNCC